MLLPVIGLLFGVLFGLLANFNIPPEYLDYVTVAVLASLDTLFGGIRAYLQNQFDDKIFVSGFLFNLLLASGLAFLGAQLGVDLYLAAIFAFGVRLFHNMAMIRRTLTEKWGERKNKE